VKMSLFALVLAAAISLSATCLSAPNAQPQPEVDRLARVLEMIEGADTTTARYDYVMTARLRLLLFWVGRDDVGGGFIRYRSSASDPAIRAIDLLMGSDPNKAPRRINRWGASTEVVRVDEGGKPVESGFFGFMKSSREASLAEAQRNLADEQLNGKFYFITSLCHVSRDGSVARVVPFVAEKDTVMSGSEEAGKMAVEKARTPSVPVRSLDPSQASCAGVHGLLFATQGLLDAAVAGMKSPPPPVCYVYNAHRYTVSLVEMEKVSEKTIRFKRHGQQKETAKSYRDLLRAQFVVRGEEGRKRAQFEILCGTKEPLRAVPIQISYQPNWWFKVVLNLSES